MLSIPVHVPALLTWSTGPLLALVCLLHWLAALMCTCTRFEARIASGYR